MSEEPHLIIAPATPNFSALRLGHGIYVDKTRYFHQLITQFPTFGAYFFSRPRRFGKSLMLSTLKYIFRGRRDLFQGLYIDTQTDYDWKVYPVIHLDMSEVNGRTIEAIENSLYKNTRDALEAAGLNTFDETCSAADLLGDGIARLHEKGPVVVLVDEYDAPVGKKLNTPALAEQIRETLADYYVKLKAKSPLIRFMLMTGVAKFTKLSIFSSLNSPTDITLDPAYAAMLGYTDEELEANFDEQLHHRAEQLEMPYDVFRAELKRWFNGYRFTLEDTRVYNPVSIAQTLTSNMLFMGAPWTETGRPTMLATFLKTHDIASLNFENGISARLADLESKANLQALEPTALLFQTGYLTITKGSLRSDRITLGFPDEEVRRDMYRFISDIRAGRDGWCLKALTHLEDGKVDAFLTSLTSLYDGLPYHPKDKRLPESHYQGVLKGVMLGGGFVCTCEELQADGHRSDLTVDTEDFFYIFELKCDKTLPAEDALAQIRNRKYTAPHLGKGKPVIAVGLVFDPDDHTLRDSAWQTVDVPAHPMSDTP